MTLLRRKCRGGHAGRRVFGIASGTVRAGLASATTSAFTIMELLVVITIIIALAGLILSTSGYVQKKSARSRAEAEIAALSAALENFKADNGAYPTSGNTDNLRANAEGDPRRPSYVSAGKDLYLQISGDSDGNPTTPGNGKNYMGSGLKPNMIAPKIPGPNSYIVDPFGNCYGYSTVKAATPTGGDGYNPTFDLWSTAGTTSGNASDRNQWIKNW